MSLNVAEEPYEIPQSIFRSLKDTPTDSIVIFVAIRFKTYN